MSVIQIVSVTVATCKLMYEVISVLLIQVLSTGLKMGPD